MRPILQGAVAVLAVPALSLSALVATTAASSAVATADPAPAAAAAAWLDGQVPGSGLFTGDFGADYGLTIDVALALDAAEDHDATVASIRDAVADHVNSYIAYSYPDSNDSTVTHTGESGGSTAKALVLDRRTGGTGTDFGGVDLVDRLESLIDADGRVISTADGAPDPSYDNTYIQTLAVAGLAGTGSPARDSAVDYLLAQQCTAEGYFRGDIAEDAGDPCADEADTDSTAQAVLALQDDAAAAAASAKAVSWLLDAQKPDGSFGGGVATKASNANSTALAGAALGATGQDEAAAHAAAWLRAHQAANVAHCVFYDAADLGAVLYDDAARTAAQDGPMDAALVAQTVRATSQVIPALQAARTSNTAPHAIFTAEYVKAGGKKPVGVGDAAPGEAVCAMLGEQSVLGFADVDGDVDLPVRIPARTKVSKVKVANAGGRFDTIRINALGATRLTVSVKKKSVSTSAWQVVRVTGLAPGESARVSVEVSYAGGSTGAGVGGQANRKGVFRVRTTAPQHAGTARVKAKGAFGNRSGRASFTVTR